MKISMTNEQLKKAGLKSTPHRIAVLNILEGSEDARTAEDIYKTLSETGCRINLSTVYRILDSLVDRRIVSRSVLMDQNKALYELCGRQHRHYLICTACRRKVEIGDCPLHRLEHDMAAETGFRIEAHRLELYGICPECCK